MKKNLSKTVNREIQYGKSTKKIFLSSLQSRTWSNGFPDWLLHHEALALDGHGNDCMAQNMQVSE